ncbi:MAG: CHRD domain-containing protein [Flavobacteriales bacterium]
MDTRYAFFSSLAFSLSVITASASHLQPHILFSARMNAAQQVPTNNSTALGLGGLTLNATHDTLCVNISWTGLSSAITGLHIHEGLPGINGPVLLDLVPFIQGDRVMTTITGAALTPDLIAKHLRGELYLNLHTMNNPNGEIRGQIIPETDMAFVADLNGMQQVPMVSTNAFGLGTFLLAKHTGTLKFHAVLTGLSGPVTAVHFHSGAMGTAGPVVQDLDAFLSGNTVSGEVDPTPFLADLLAGNIYLNVHTAANPNGEIRGQLMMPLGIAFDARLNGAQQVPPVTTTGMGVASFVSTWDMDSIRYDVVVNGLSGPMTAAHLHTGAVGTTGPVSIDIADGIVGERITGWITNVAQADVIELLEGNLYVNVHTAMNPNGEIRGQVYRYMREGYTIALDGAQQVPPVSTTASGSGIVSVDRDQSNAHIMFVTNAAMVNAAHFHYAAAGTSGPVIFDMSDLLANNGVFTYWKSTDATPFTLANSLSLRRDSLYLNVHTMGFPNGEVRGQVRRGAVCSDIMSGVMEDGPGADAFGVWPVPTQDQLNLWLPERMDANAVLEVIDVLGSVVAIHGIAAHDRSASINVASLPAGVYFARIHTGQRMLVARFTKE